MKKWIFLIWSLAFSFSAYTQTPQWKEIQTPVKASLRGLSPVSGQICWASGSEGTWLRTIDGGKTWKVGIIAGLDTVDFRSIHAFDENIAVVASAGQPAVIYRTENGGESWSKVHQEGELAFFDAIVFSSTNTGYVLGDPVDSKWMILKTEDGGKTWKMLSPLPESIEGEAAFAASSSSLIADLDQVVFATGGSISRIHKYSLKSGYWSNKKLDSMAQGEPAKGAFAMTSINGKNIMVGGDYTLLNSKEGNAVIQDSEKFSIPSIRPLGYRSGVAFWAKNDLLIAVGPGGSDYSNNEGITWASFSKTGFHAVKESLEGDAIWASGSQGRIGILIF